MNLHKRRHSHLFELNCFELKVPVKMLLMVINNKIFQFNEFTQTQR